jgi:hypothetical protein
VSGSVEVDRLEELIALATLPHGDGEMEDVSGSPGGPAAELGIGDTARDDLGSQAGQQIGVGPFLGAVSESEHHYLRPQSQPFLGQVGDDEPGATGDKEPHPNRSARAATMRPLAWPSP